MELRISFAYDGIFFIINVKRTRWSRLPLAAYAIGVHYRTHRTIFTGGRICSCKTPAMYLAECIYLSQRMFRALLFCCRTRSSPPLRASTAAATGTDAGDSANTAIESRERSVFRRICTDTTCARLEQERRPLIVVAPERFTSFVITEGATSRMNQKTKG